MLPSDNSTTKHQRRQTPGMEMHEDPPERYRRISTSRSSAKCRSANARPEPDFRYRSKRRAICSVENSIEMATDHGRYRAVWPHSAPAKSARGGGWLGGRDSNPDNGVQSAVSYR